jgi:hypothetical protein
MPIRYPRLIEMTGWDLNQRPSQALCNGNTAILGSKKNNTLIEGGEGKEAEQEERNIK